MKQVAYYKASSRRCPRRSSTPRPRRSPEGRPRAARPRDGHVLRCGRHPRGGARLLPPPERAHPRVRGGDGLRDVDDDLQRLHANLRQADLMLKGDDALLARVNAELAAVGVPPYSGAVEVKHFLWLVADGEGFELLKASAHKGLKGIKIVPVLRLPDPAAVEAALARGPGQAVVARAHHRGVRRRGRRLSGEGQVLRLPDHPGARGHRALGEPVQPLIEQAIERGRRDRHVARSATYRSTRSRS